MGAYASLAPVSHSAPDTGPVPSSRSIVLCLVVLSVIAPRVCGGTERAGFSPSARDSFDRGLKQFRAADYQQAVEWFSAVIAQHPDAAEAYEYRGRAYRELERNAVSQGDKDEMFLKSLSDNSKARELRAEVEIASFLKRRVAALLGIDVVYLGTWIAVQFYWLRKGLTPGLPGLVFVFSHLVAYLLPFLAAKLLGPVGLLGVFLYALQTPTPSTAVEKPFEDHPLELALAQSSPVQDRNDSSFEAWTRPCPKCGREVASTTRVCPRCENRIS